jgi:hypothetical protein
MRGITLKWAIRKALKVSEINENRKEYIINGLTDEEVCDDAGVTNAQIHVTNLGTAENQLNLRCA